MSKDILEYRIYELLSDGNEWGVNAIARALGMHPNGVSVIDRYLKGKQKRFKQTLNRKWVVAGEVKWPASTMSTHEREMTNDPVTYLGDILKEKARLKQEVDIRLKKIDYWEDLGQRAMAGEFIIKPPTIKEGSTIETEQSPKETDKEDRVNRLLAKWMGTKDIVFMNEQELRDCHKFLMGRSEEDIERYFNDSMALLGDWT
jgi:hypothetical protein